MHVKQLFAAVLVLLIPIKATASDDMPVHAGFRHAIAEDCDPSRHTVVGLHFMGGSAAVSQALFALPDSTVNFVAVEGAHAFEDGRSWFAADHYDKPVSDQNAELVETADALALFLQDIDAICPTRGRPIVTGYSQGGDLVHLLAIRHAHLIGAAIPMGARFFENWRYAGRDSQEKPPIILIHGGSDFVVSPTNALRAAEFYATNARHITLRLFEGTGHAYPPEMRAFYRAMVRDLVSRLESDRQAAQD
ncbi:MAG: alpha/beta hydrolase [Parasphingopyxis sp.]|uniref:alpha/beta hydrolase n=1 Tax=Parasphingopyxis sp. TaxID=1920299 RepID=UPI003F9FDEAD